MIPVIIKSTIYKNCQLEIILNNFSVNYNKIATSIDSPVSFEVVKQCFEEIKEIRSDFQVSQKFRFIFDFLNLFKLFTNLKVNLKM